MTDMQSEIRSTLEILWRAWFPRCLDRESGGFFSEYDRTWRPHGLQYKLLEFQARQTMFASELLLWDPDEPLFAESAEWGFECLRSQLWDSQWGGWFHCISRDGQPLEASTKHVHGFCYGIQACVTFYLASGRESALELAKEAFEWIERHSHDPEHGGYLGFLTREGSLIREMCPLWPSPVDSIATPLGLKDLNVHSDLLEALICLAEVWNDSRVRGRVEELVSIITDHSLAPTGALHFLSSVDWRPVPHGVVVGNAMQTICRLVWAARLLQRDSLNESARSIWSWAERCAREAGLPGYAAVSTGELPFRRDGGELRVRIRPWWVQFEALRAMLTLGEIDDGGAWETLVRNHWRYLRDDFVDPKHGGCKPGTCRHLRFPWQRLYHSLVYPDLYTHKGHLWKDGSHDGRAVLHALRVSSGRSGLSVLPKTRAGV